MEKTLKITAHVPEDVLVRAKAASGKGTTETVRLALDMLAATKAARDLRALRGRLKLDIDLADLRRDRR